MDVLQDACCSVRTLSGPNDDYLYSPLIYGSHQGVLTAMTNPVEEKLYVHMHQQGLVLFHRRHFQDSSVAKRSAIIQSSQLM